MIRNTHEGPGVLPGRYAGEAIPISDGPTPEQLAFQQHKAPADGLAGRICAAAADAARSQHVLLELIGQFDAMGGLSERLPGSHREADSDGRSVVIAIARDDAGRPLATTALTGPDPYEMTASLLAWGAIHAAAPDAVLKPGVHGPVDAFGLDTLKLGAAEAGLHEADKSSARRP